VNVKEVEKDGSIAHLHMQYYLYLLLTPKPSFNLLNLPYFHSKGWGTSNRMASLFTLLASPLSASQNDFGKNGAKIIGKINTETKNKDRQFGSSAVSLRRKDPSSFFCRFESLLHHHLRTSL